MKTLLLVVTLSCISTFTFSQLNRIKFDESKNQEILYGECTENAFMQGEFGSWFNNEYEAYNVNTELFNPNYTTPFDSVYVFLATWCNDTRRELPRFCKVMDNEYFAATKIEYFALDGKKHNDVIDTEEYYVEFVPTMIFYYGGNELCRIIEAPIDSMEEDIMDLLSRFQ